MLSSRCRQLSARCSRSRLQLFEPTADEPYVYEIEVENGQVLIKGTNTFALGAALKMYLKKYLNASVCWEGKFVMGFLVVGR